jgi:hypothetical protein
MKHTFTILIILLLGISGLQSQNERLVLVEGFSSATCGPCASQNPAWNALLAANQDILTSIKYQMNWPSPGNDPMYHHNPQDNTARRNYYSVNTVPRAIINGNYFQGMPSQVNQSMLETVSALTSPFRIQLHHQLSANQDSIFVTMLIKADAPVSGDLVAHIAVIEKHIHFVNPPGTNGERDFYNIMKALLPSRNGTSLPDFEGFEYILIEAAWKLQNVYEIDQLAAVAFIQDNADKHVHQAAKSSTDPIVPYFENDATISRVYNYTKSSCNGLTSAKAVLKNHGSQALTSAHIVASLNGEEMYSQTWTGNLGFLEGEVIDLGEMAFDVEPSNDLVVEVVETNGGADDYPANVSHSASIASAENATGNVKLFILLDNKPEEITWELINANTGEVVQTGGPYSAPGALTIPMEVSDNNCYEFVIYDAGGDGLCCGHGTGYYGMLQGNDPMFTGSFFGASERYQFGYGLVGLDEVASESSIQLHPNPAINQASVHLELQKSARVRVSLNDLTGSEINTIDYGKMAAGTYQLSEWFVQVPKGVYLVTIQEGENITTRKLIVQ